MKGLEVTEEEYRAILTSFDWQPLLRFDNEGNVFVDLKKYSKLGHYLPIESEYQSYVVGYLIMKKLYECPYRTQDDLVCVYPARPKTPKPRIIKERVPVLKEIKYASGESAATPYADHEYIEIEKPIVNKEQE